MNKSLYFVLSHEEQYNAVSKIAGKRVQSKLFQYVTSVLWSLVKSRAATIQAVLLYNTKNANFFS